MHGTVVCQFAQALARWREAPVTPKQEGSPGFVAFFLSSAEIDLVGIR